MLSPAGAERAPGFTLGVAGHGNVDVAWNVRVLSLVGRHDTRGVLPAASHAWRQSAIATIPHRARPLRTPPAHQFVPDAGGRSSVPAAEAAWPSSSSRVTPEGARMSVAVSCSVWDRPIASSVRSRSRPRVSGTRNVEAIPHRSEEHTSELQSRFDL